jgi:hypothetical protein
MSLQSYFQFVKINYGLSLAVGYQDEINQPGLGVGVPLTLFSGAIRFCRRYREGADMIVYIEAEGAMWNIGGAYYSCSYAAGIDVYSVLQNLGQTLNVPIANMAAVQSHKNATYSAGFSFAGSAYNLVRQLCNRIGFNFIIDSGEIRLIQDYNPQTGPQNVGAVPGSSIVYQGALSPQNGVTLSKATGLLQPPQPEENNVGVPDESSEASGGSSAALPTARWKIDALLFPRVTAGDFVNVKSEYLAGGQCYMLVIEIEYTGDNRKDDWKMEAICIPTDSSGNPIENVASPLVQGAASQ